MIKEEEVHDAISSVVDQLTKVNNLEFNMAKVIEEAAEVTELLTKYLTKIPSLKPQSASITEEVGDLIFRLMVLSRHMNIENEVGLRVEDKAAMLKKALYKGNMGSTLIVTKTRKD